MPEWRSRPVVVFGCGGLGVSAAWTLVLAGARRLVLVDHDVVDASNLHRQVLYSERDVGRAKVDALAEALVAIDPAVVVSRIAQKVGRDDIEALIADAVAVVEATDDAEMKFHVNDAVVAAWRSGRGAQVAVVAAAIGRRGQYFVLRPGGSCYRCLFEAPPPPELVASCRVAGVIGPVVGEVGALATRSLVATLDGRGDPAASALLRLGPGGLHRLAVARALDCGCGAAPAAGSVLPGDGGVRA